MKPFSPMFLFISLLISASLNAQNKDTRNEYSFMFYNTENFFDCENDLLTADDEFTPEGTRRWTWSRFHAKANRIAKVILAAGKWNAPVFVGLCEIENRQVLETLTMNASLKNFAYKIVHKDSPDERGIDVALIYRSEIFHPFDYQAIRVSDPQDSNFKTRDILEVTGVLNDCDTLCVFVNHWPSRYGGMMETIRLRELAASTLKKSIMEATKKYPSAKIICMGDFNDSPRDESLATVLGAKEIDDPTVSGELINLAFSWLTRPIQTIKNQYSWAVFDQWIVSDNFLAENSYFKFLKAEIFTEGFLLEPDLKFGGVKPKRTYVGYNYQEGFSDHLPIILRFHLSNH